MTNEITSASPSLLGSASSEFPKPVASRHNIDFFQALSRSYQLRLAAMPGRRSLASRSDQLRQSQPGAASVGTVMPGQFSGADQQTPASASTAGMPPNSGSIHEMVAAAAQRQGIPSALLAAVVQVESGFQPQAVSSAGAKGLTQLMDGTARTLGVTNSFDPWQNLTGGAKFLSGLLSRYHGNVSLALAAYNAGPGAVDAAGGAIPPYEETQRYVRLVSAVYHRNLAAQGTGGNE